MGDGCEKGRVIVMIAKHVIVSLTKGDWDYICTMMV